MIPALRTRLRLAGALLLVALLVALSPSTARPASAESYVRVSGAGSSWSANAIDQFRRNVQQFGLRVDYTASGSSDGRRQFLNGTIDFAASDIPFQFEPEDGSAPENPAAGSYAYMPVTAGGTVFMYNLTINGKRVTNLRVSGANITKIFTGAITQWNDPALAADNPGLALPARAIVPVVRSDGSGSTAQLTAWMISQHKDLWTAYCQKSGRAPRCGQTSYYPTVKGMIAQSGDLGVAGYVQQSYAEGAVGYVNYSYALNAGFPVAKLLNAAGYYTEPTPDNVAVSLLKADINRDQSSRDYLTQKLEGVYAGTDKRTYPLSSYSYLILPTKVQGQFDENKGKTMGAFTYYAMCQAQEQSASLGYSPMPINLVQAGFDQIRRIPGAVVQDIKLESCKNPTFSSDGHNILADTAPQPQECDKQGPTQCATGTGGASKIKTAVSGASAAATGGGGSGGAGGGTSGTGVTTPGGGSATGGTGGGTTGTGGDAAALGGQSPEGCDPDVGCASNTGGGTSGGGSGTESAASPQLLDASSGWGGAQALMVLAVLLVLAIVLGPTVALQLLHRRESST